MPGTPEGKKNTAPVPAPARDEDGYSAKTHLHQPVQETATVAATALLADEVLSIPFVVVCLTLAIRN